MAKEQGKPWPYFMEHVAKPDGTLALAICKVVAVKIMPASTEEEWNAASAEVKRMNAEYRKEQPHGNQ